jgi:hypothetical protein
MKELTLTEMETVSGGLEYSSGSHWVVITGALACATIITGGGALALVTALAAFGQAAENLE